MRLTFVAQMIVLLVVTGLLASIVVYVFADTVLEYMRGYLRYCTPLTSTLCRAYRMVEDGVRKIVFLAIVYILVLTFLGVLCTFLSKIELRDEGVNCYH